MPFAPDSVLNPWISLLESAALAWLALFLWYNLLRLTKHLGVVVLLFLFPISEILLMFLGVSWGGDVVIWLWSKRAIWAGIHNGMTFQVYGIGPSEWCFGGCRGEIIPHLGGLAIDETHLAMLIVPLLAYWFYFHRPHMPHMSQRHGEGTHR